MKQALQEYLVSHIVDQITTYLVSDFKLDIPSALNVIYTSETYQILSEEDSELFIQSPAYVYEWLKKEYLTGKLRIA